VKAGLKEKRPVKSPLKASLSIFKRNSQSLEEKSSPLREEDIACMAEGLTHGNNVMARLSIESGRRNPKVQ